ncbi:MAG: SHOCT domain-containing protein [Anaerolineales bacterium]
MGFGMGFGVFGLFMMLLFWGLLIFLAVWLVKALFDGRSQSFGASSEETKNPGKILDERYARGEIDREQYLQMKKDI